jgi:uncharacterized protein (TIGR02246 family)
MTSPTETAGVAAAMHRLREAWRAADIETYVAAFDEDADLVSRGGQWYRGRAQIADQLRELARTGRPALFAAERRTESIRMLTRAVAIAHEVWLEPDRTAHATYVLAHRDDGWRVSAATVVLQPT